MLDQFISKNQAELINRCYQESGSGVPEAAAKYGMSVFLDQLVETLQRRLFANSTGSTGVDSRAAIRQAAVLRGIELHRLGAAIEVVVREFGNVRHAITELAIETSDVISNDEFRILNLCLDDAILHAVASFARAGETTRAAHDGDPHVSGTALAGEERRLVDIAIRAFDTIRQGSVSANGANGALVSHALAELRRLVSHGEADGFRKSSTKA